MGWIDGVEVTTAELREYGRFKTLSDTALLGCIQRAKLYVANLSPDLSKSVNPAEDAKALVMAYAAHLGRIMEPRPTSLSVDGVSASRPAPALSDEFLQEFLDRLTAFRDVQVMYAP